MELTDLIPFAASLAIFFYHVAINAWCILLCVLLWVGFCFAKPKIFGEPGRASGNGQGVVITGCDTGFGHGLALRLEELGFTVFAGCLFPEGDGAKRLAKKRSNRLHVLPLDVTNDESIQNAVKTVTTRCPKSGLLAVVNNAGINVCADVELASLDLYQRFADVNIYGMIRVTKAFCPLIRKYKGRFVNVTSVKGRLALPLDSVYTITKFAGESFSDILRREMARFGVKVVIVEPGDFGGITGMLNKENLKRFELTLNNAYESASPDVKDAYGRAYVDALISGFSSYSEGSATSIEPVVEKMVDAVTLDNPANRYLVDGSNKLFDKYCVLARIGPFLPEAIMDWLIKIFFPLPLTKQSSAVSG